MEKNFLKKYGWKHFLVQNTRTHTVAINCEENKEENDICHNFHHAHCDPESFLRHICQDGSSSGSPFKNDNEIANKTPV